MYLIIKICPNIIKLDISYCKCISLNGILQISHLYYLKELNLEGIDCLNNKCISILENIPNLININISRCNNLNGKDIENLLMWSDNIQVIKLDYCIGLTTESLDYIVTQLVNIKSLSIKGCNQLNNDVLYSIADYCPDIEELDIENCTSFTTLGVYLFYNSYNVY